MNGEEMEIDEIVKRHDLSPSRQAREGNLLKLKDIFFSLRENILFTGPSKLKMKRLSFDFEGGCVDAGCRMETTLAPCALRLLLL